jgi:hypothetical protein
MWDEALANPEAIRSLYDAVPGLTGVDLLELRVSCDGPGSPASPDAELRIELAEFPDNPPARWVRQAANAVQLVLKLFGVEEFRVTRFSRGTQADIVLTRSGDGKVVVEATGPGRELRIVCAHAFVGSLTGYLRGDRGAGEEPAADA